MMMNMLKNMTRRMKIGFPPSHVHPTWRRFNVRTCAFPRKIHASGDDNPKIHDCSADDNPQILCCTGDDKVHVKMMELLQYVASPAYRPDPLYREEDWKRVAAQHGRLIRRGLSNSPEAVRDVFDGYFSLMKLPPLSLWPMYKIPYLDFMDWFKSYLPSEMKGEAASMIHAIVIKMGTNDYHRAVMIKLYGRVGDVESYGSLFSSVGDKPSWAVMKSFFMAEVDNRPAQAISFFAKMESAGFKPDIYTARSVLAAHVRSPATFRDTVEFFVKIRQVYKLETTTIEYSCLVDKLIRSDGLEAAIGELERSRLMSSELCNIIFSECTRRFEYGITYNLGMAMKMINLVRSAEGEYELCNAVFDRLETAGVSLPPNLTRAAPQKSKSTLI